MTQFITLAGRKQVGKDTSAEIIKRLLTEKPKFVGDRLPLDEGKVHIVHFADVLKKACHIIFGIPLEDMESEVGKKKLTHLRWPKKLTIAELDEYTVWVPDPNGAFMTVREVLQYVGTDLFRTQMNPDVWVESVYRKKYLEDDVVIVADCRFPNEAEFARDNGVLIGVERDTGLKCDGHKSETALDDYDGYHHLVVNDGNFEELRQKLRDILANNTVLEFLA